MIEKLKNIPLFYEMDLKVLKSLIDKKQIFQQSYRKGATVHEQYSECFCIDVVLSGKLVAYSLASNGSETIVFEFKKGSVIGANLLFSEQNKYPINIYCTADCVLFHISKFSVSELLKEYSFVMQFVKSLSLSSQEMNKKITMYAQKSLRKNLIVYFLAISNAQKSNTIVLPVTKKQLADYFGVQRPSLFRELKRMKDEGLLDINNRIIMLNYLNKQN